MSEEAQIVPATAQAALANLIVVLADNKYWLGRRLSEWTVKAPSLESGVACAAIAGEELGTARVVYPLLTQIPTRSRPVPLERETDRSRHYNVGLLDYELPTWTHVVAALVLVDSAINVIMESVATSSYSPLAKRASRILDEERFHAKFTEGRVRELAATRRGRAALQERVNELMPEMLAWFGPDDEPGIQALVEERLIAERNPDLRSRWLQRLRELLEPYGLSVPAPVVDWTRWNALQRRLEPVPAPALR